MENSKETGVTENGGLELVIDAQIMNYLFSIAKHEDVKHKIVEIANLINEELYESIIQDNTEQECVQGCNTIDETTQNGTNKVVNREVVNGMTNIENMKNMTYMGNMENMKNMENMGNMRYMINMTNANTISNGLLQNEAQLKQYDVFENFYNWDELHKSNNLSQNFGLYYKHKIQNKDAQQIERQKHKILFLCYDGYNQYDKNCILCKYNENKYIWNIKLKNPLYKDPNPSFENYFFILGSTSTSRKHILENSNIHFLTVPIKINETKIGCRKKHDPLTLTANISIGKGIKLLHTLKKDKQLHKKVVESSMGRKILLLVGDEVIYCNNSIYEKPKNVSEALHFLDTYRNNKCYSYCSLSVIDLQTENIITGIDETLLCMSDFHKDNMKDILKDPSVFWCAGALKIENGEMCKFVKSIRGSIDSIFGVSINLLVHLVNLL